MLTGGISGGIEEVLWEIAEAEARAEGLSIARSCEGHLRNFIATGAQSLRIHTLDRDPVTIERAEENIRLFVRAMADEARALGLTELHEPTFFSALQKLCALFPFC